MDEADLEAAIRRTLDEIDPRVVLLYEDLAHVGRETAMQNVLWMIASGDQDRFGRFQVIESHGHVRVAGNPVGVAQWTRLIESGAVRPCPTAGFGLYAFSEAMLPHYILLRAAVGDMAGADTLRESIAPAGS